MTCDVMNDSEFLLKLFTFCKTYQVHGNVWNEADEEAHRLAEKDGMLYVHPFHNPRVW